MISALSEMSESEYPCDKRHNGKSRRGTCDCESDLPIEDGVVDSVEVKSLSLEPDHMRIATEKTDRDRRGSGTPH